MASRSFAWSLAVCGLLSGVAWISACSALVDLDGLTGGTLADATTLADAREDAPIDTSVDAGMVDAGGEAGAVAPSCPQGSGPAMVLIDNEAGAPLFCIDSTEATSAQYTEFLHNDEGALAKLPASCAFKTSFSSISTSGQIPVNIDWCDAYAFCAWAGKRICGKIGGGQNAFSDFATLDSQWYYACSARGQNAFPYGNTYMPGVCDDAANDAGGPVPAGSLASCVGGFPGLFDMSGNMWEWEDSCLSNGDGGSENDQCRARGGTWVDGDPTLRCDFDDLNHFNPSRGNPGIFVGVRCCADL